MNTKHLFFICIVSTSIFAMKNEETSLTLCNTDSTHDDLFYTPYLSTIHKKNPISESEKSLFCELTNKNCSDITNYLDNKHSELTKLAHKYKIQNLYIALLAQTISALKIPNELQNIIIKHYNSLITYTSNPNEALDHFKQSLLNYKIPTKITEKKHCEIPHFHQYSYNKKYALNGRGYAKMRLYDTKTNSEIILKEQMVTACFLHKKNALVYINSQEQLVHYDITTKTTTIIAADIPRNNNELNRYCHMGTGPNNCIFIISQYKSAPQLTTLMLTSLENKVVKTIINSPFKAISFNKNCSQAVISSNAGKNSIITLYAFNNENLNYLTHANTDITYTKLHFNKSYNSFIAKTTKYNKKHKATVFHIIHNKNDDTYSLEETITSDQSNYPIKLHSPKWNCPSILIQKLYNINNYTYRTSVNTFNHDGTGISLANYPWITASSISKNSQYFALINDKKELTIQDVSTLNVLAKYQESPSSWFNPKLIFHPNNTLLINQSPIDTIIHTTTGNISKSIGGSCTSTPSMYSFHHDETVFCDGWDSYELYSPEDLKSLDDVIPNDSINLLQYFALKRINDRSKGSDGTYTVPQTMFNTLCWNSFSNDNRELLSKTLNLKIEN